ncbi:MAG TPA: thioredoxin family protein [Pirellulaceae bacterium]|nr:thioredoxin family protein [Pirellulaceae bacterium]
MNFAPYFDAALPYADFLEKYGTQSQRDNWRAVYDRAKLTVEQEATLGRFRRRMQILCFAGAWCGDCVDQCPLLQRIAEGTETIDLRFVDRDADEALKAEMSLCGGARVPQVVFLDEEGAFLGRYGDRTLAKYRTLVETLDGGASGQAPGAACPTGLFGPGEELLAATLADWFREIERVQWMLRTSARLRQKHGD